jgi:3-hydroxybutyryl-CoA dehydrogenase
VDTLDLGFLHKCARSRIVARDPTGPLEPCDFIGLDVLYAVCDSLCEEFKRPEYAPPPLMKRMVVSGHHGRNSGRGLYECS